MQLIQVSAAITLRPQPRSRLQAVAELSIARSIIMVEELADVTLGIEAILLALELMCMPRQVDVELLLACTCLTWCSGSQSELESACTRSCTEDQASNLMVTGMSRPALTVMARKPRRTVSDHSSLQV